MAEYYVPTNWINRKTQLNADNMNKIEQELARLSRLSGGIKRVLEGPGIIVTPGAGEVTVGLKSGTSEDNLLVLDSENGLILTLSLSYDKDTRKLKLSSGSGWSEEIEFDIDKALVDGNYDPDTRTIILTMSDGNDIIIDMSKLDLNWRLLDTDSIKVTEHIDEFGYRTFKFDAKVSEYEHNNLIVKDDGLYSEKLKWTNLGISDETGGRWEFEGEIGNEFWHFESGKCIDINKINYSDIDFYEFKYILSPDEGNSLLIKEDGGLYMPEATPEMLQLQDDLDKLRDEYDRLNKTTYKISKSVKLTESIDPDTGYRIVTADAKVSSISNNEIRQTEDGLMVDPMKPSDDGPDLTEVNRRTLELEKGYPRMREELTYIQTTAIIKD